MGYTNSPKMGKVWYYIGMIGTLVLIIILVTTRIPDNPITGRGGSISIIGFATELFQVIYIIVNLIIVLKDRNVNRKRDVINSVCE
ncbi:MAG: hypothetical protein WB975_07445 [Nitrososphaeraceae archaeon]